MVNKFRIINKSLTKLVKYANIKKFCYINHNFESYTFEGGGKLIALKARHAPERINWAVREIKNEFHIEFSEKVVVYSDIGLLELRISLLVPT